VLNQKVCAGKMFFVLCIMYCTFFLARMVWQGVSAYPSAPAFVINAIIRERKKSIWWAFWVWWLCRRESFATFSVMYFCSFSCPLHGEWTHVVLSMWKGICGDWSFFRAKETQSGPAIILYKRLLGKVSEPYGFSVLDLELLKVLIFSIFKPRQPSCYQ